MRERQLESSPPDDHAELLSVGVADSFRDSGADEALAKAFLRSVTTQGGKRVRAIADLSDVDTIDMLESLGFVGDSSTSQQIPYTDLWAQTS